MSLCIYLSAKYKNRKALIHASKVQEYEFEFKGYDGFGPESWRKHVWGHDAIEELGCKLIHKLKIHDLYIYDDDLYVIQEDMKLILSNAEVLSHKIEYINGNTTLKNKLVGHTQDVLALIQIAIKYKHHVRLTIS